MAKLRRFIQALTVTYVQQQIAPDNLIVFAPGWIRCSERLAAVTIG